MSEQARIDRLAEAFSPPVDQPYGDREAGVKDVAGNHRPIATHLTGAMFPRASAP